MSNPKHDWYGHAVKAGKKIPRQTDCRKYSSVSSMDVRYQQGDKADRGYGQR